MTTLRREASGTVRMFRQPDGADLGAHPCHVEIEVGPEGRGRAEFSVESLDYYADIGLWFEDGELVDFDGTHSLPGPVKEGLRALGFTIGNDF